MGHLKLIHGPSGWAWKPLSELLIALNNRAFTSFPLLLRPPGDRLCTQLGILVLWFD